MPCLPDAIEHEFILLKYTLDLISQDDLADDDVMMLDTGHEVSFTFHVIW